MTARFRSWGGWLSRRVPAGDRGSAAIELAIVTPVVIVMLLVVVALGRFSHGRLLVEQASAAAARSASLTSSPFQASTAARQAAAATLANGGLSCASMQVSVDSGSFHAGGEVTVTVTCTANLSDLAVAGVPGSARLTATARSPLETYRQLSSGFGNPETAGGNRSAGDRP